MRGVFSIFTIILSTGLIYLGIFQLGTGSELIKKEYSGTEFFIYTLKSPDYNFIWDANTQMLSLVNGDNENLSLNLSNFPGNDSGLPVILEDWTLVNTNDQNLISIIPPCDLINLEFHLRNKNTEDIKDNFKSLYCRISSEISF